MKASINVDDLVLKKGDKLLDCYNLDYKVVTVYMMDNKLVHSN